jgi:hypothetical protein
VVCGNLTNDLNLPADCDHCQINPRLKPIWVGFVHTATVNNGTEFASDAMDLWAYKNGVHLDFIRPGKPVENGYIESFNGKLRDECLTRRSSLRWPMHAASWHCGGMITTTTGLIQRWPIP